MGVPKFYRWLSERYPLLNQRVDGPSVADIDALYLDMNGIIHNCTHGNDEHASAAFRTEGDMMLAVFRYIDRIFQICRPKKLLYMAIDGVAPRAKQNQQRSRRFRTARDIKESYEAECEKAVKERKEKPQRPFDSNCITPGTDFMYKLQFHLEYFIRQKIKDDTEWQKVKIILSGPEVPGEGEHKILEYIRHAKSQPGYEPNMRHCMYGLDADLIMLGLVSHEPHFCLLREVVDFGRGARDAKKKATVTQTDFHFLHLGLLREYWDLEYKSLKLPFPYSLERVIDDITFLCFLVGNDFVPSLPTLNIAWGGLDQILELYRELLPTFNGYITDGANVDIRRFERLIRIIGEREHRVFNELTGNDGKKKKKKKGPTELTLDDELGDDEYVFANLDDDEALAKVQEATRIDDAVEQMRREAAAQEEGDRIAMEQWKEKYYREKLGIEPGDEDAMHAMRKSYLEALLWIRNYYYHGVCSWNWFFPYHYAPCASDLHGLDAYDIQFDLGTPYLPMQQLLSVLPPESGNFLPKCFRDLMTKSTSPIIDFYPSDFGVDMDMKKNPWEGVVLIPFIEESRLLAAYNSVDMTTMTPDEVARNKNTNAWDFTYDPSNDADHPTSLPGLLPNIECCKSKKVEHILPPIPGGLKFKPVLCAGVKKGKFSPPGFPSFEHIPCSAELKECGVNMFGFASKKKSAMVKVELSDKSPKDPFSLIGKTVFVQYPYPREGVVVAVTNHSKTQRLSLQTREVEDGSADRSISKLITTEAGRYMEKKAIHTGKVDTLVTVAMIKGSTIDADGGTVKEFEEEEEHFPFQMVMTEVSNPDGRYENRKAIPIDKAFPADMEVVHIGTEMYGCAGKVSSANAKEGITLKLVQSPPEPNFREVCKKGVKSATFYPAHVVAKKLGVSTLLLSKLTGSLEMRSSDRGRFDVGLGLKFSGKNLQRDGLAKKEDGQGVSYGGWQFSEKAANIIYLYKTTFPQFFEKLEKFAGDDLDPTLVFPGTNEARKEMIDKVLAWLAGTGISALPLVPCGSQTLQKETIEVITQTLKGYKEMKAKAAGTTKEVAKCRPFYVVRKGEPLRALNAKLLPTFDVGDRVCNLSSTGKVPFGLRGTIVGVAGEQLQIAFDDDFMAGTNLYGRINGLSGALLPRQGLLNLSKPNIVAFKKAQQPSTQKSTMLNSFQAQLSAALGVSMSKLAVKSKEDNEGLKATADGAARPKSAPSEQAKPAANAPKAWTGGAVPTQVKSARHHVVSKKGGQQGQGAPMNKGQQQGQELMSLLLNQEKQAAAAPPPAHNPVPVGDAQAGSQILQMVQGGAGADQAGKKGKGGKQQPKVILTRPPPSNQQQAGQQILNMVQGGPNPGAVPMGAPPPAMLVPGPQGMMMMPMMAPPPGAPMHPGMVPQYQQAPPTAQGQQQGAQLLSMIQPGGAPPEQNGGGKPKSGGNRGGRKGRGGANQ